MSDLTHDQVREQLSSGEMTLDAEQHVTSCAECSSWNATLERIRGAAPSMFTEAPPEIADRVLTTVRTAGPAVVALEGARRSRSIWQHVGARAAIAAGIAGAVAVGALSIPGGSQPALVAAASKTEAAKTARVEIESSFSFTPAEPITVPTPDLRRFRADLRAKLPAELAPLGEALAKAPDPPKVAPIRTIRSSTKATGEVAFPDRLRLSGTGTETHATNASASGRFETIVIGKRSWIRTPLFGETYIRVPAFPAAVHFDFHPARLIFDARDHGDGATRVGEERLDGEEVVHYRFTARNDFGDTLGSHDATVDAWVGVSDGHLRKLVESYDERSGRGTLEARTTVRLHSFGARVSIEAPPADETMTLDEAVAGFLGFGFGIVGAAFSYSIEAAATMPAFVFPRLELPEFKFTFPDITLPDFRFPVFEFPKLEFPTFEFPNLQFDFGGFDFGSGFDFGGGSSASPRPRPRATLSATASCCDEP